MSIPNADKAIVEEAKIVQYLLNAAHSENGGKAEFFAALGFSATEWELLAAALRKICVTAALTKSIESAHGSKYVADGSIEGPLGKKGIVRTVWIVDK